MISRATFLRCVAVLWMGAAVLRGWHLRSLVDTEFWSTLLGDAARYHEWAQTIAAGDWVGSGTFYQAPLYPYALALVYSATGPSLLAARVVHCMLGATACVLLAFAGRRFFSPASGLLAGALLALSPAAVFHDGLLQKTVLATFLACALLASMGRVLHRPSLRGWFLCGLLAGLLGLVRENALLIALVLSVWAIRFPRAAGPWRAQVIRSLLLLCGLTAALGPPLLRNRVVGGEWRLTTAQFGPNFYIGNNSLADGTYSELVPEHGTPRFEQSDAAQIAEERSGRTLTPGEVSAWWTRLTLEEIRTAPGRWLRLLAQKTALAWSTVELADTEDQYTYASLSPLLQQLARALPFGLLAGLGWFGIAATSRSGRRVWALYGLLAAYTASVALFYVFARYRLPLVPLLALFAGAAFVRGTALVRRGEYRRLLACSVVGIAGWSATQPAVAVRLFPDWPDLASSQMRAVTCFNMGVALWNANAPLDRIEPWFQGSVDWNPQYASAWRFWGLTLTDFGQFDRGAWKLQRAARLEPQRADILRELGAALLQSGRPGEAIVPLEASVGLESTSADSQHLLGRALLISGRPTEALPHLQAAVALAPEFIPPRRLLAMTLDRSGRRAEAMGQFRRLYELLPDDSPERKLIRRILGRPHTPFSKRLPKSETS